MKLDFCPEISICCPEFWKNMTLEIDEKDKHIKVIVLLLKVKKYSDFPT
jgi:hypothetical protein